jgi:hypothetical protein
MPDSSGNYTLDDLIAIRSAIASGALRVEYNDRTVVYRSMNELKQAEQKVAQALGKVKRGGRVLCEPSKGTC